MANYHSCPSVMRIYYLPFTLPQDVIKSGKISPGNTLTSWHVDAIRPDSLHILKKPVLHPNTIPCHLFPVFALILTFREAFRSLHEPAGMYLLSFDHPQSQWGWWFFGWMWGKTVDVAECTHLSTPGISCPHNRGAPVNWNGEPVACEDGRAPTCCYYMCC